MIAALAFPGDLDTPSGGYAYDRRLLALLPGAGVAIGPLALPGRFPLPSPGEAEAALAALSADPAAVLLVDGLALGALPAAGLGRLKHRLVALVHHPLALEAGLSEEDRARLGASETAALEEAAAVVTTSRETARILAADYGVRPEIITVAVPGTDAAPRAKADGAPPHILAVGSLIPRKGYDLCIAALAGLAHLPWRATFVGSDAMDPPFATRLKAQVAQAGLADRIAFPGAMGRDALDRAYGEADLFVHPALYEGYGMVLAEALKRGLPLIASTGGAAGETVPDGAALKVPPGDQAALGQALAAALSDPALRRRLADASFAAGATLPSWDDTARRVAAVLKGVAARAPGAS